MSPIVVCLNGALRLTDNAAISAAISAAIAAADEGTADSVVLTHVANIDELSDVRLVSLHAAVQDVRKHVGGKLVSLVGQSGKDFFEPLTDLATQIGARKIIMQRAFEPHAALAQEQLSTSLAHLPSNFDIELQLVPGAYAVEPGTVLSGSKTPYKVFTPFSKTWRKLAMQGNPGTSATATSAPTTNHRLSRLLADNAAAANLIESINYHSDPLAGPASDAATRLTNSARTIAAHITETDALQRWEQFACEALKEYETGRDQPYLDGTSRMSAHLAFGTISPRGLISDIAERIESGLLTAAEADKFLTELAWREFYADQLFHRPEVAEHNADKRFDHYRWHESITDLDAWRDGQTGFPIVDAGMRQLAETGWMHNRVRMIVASFLIKDLHLRWQDGAAVFRDRLVDYSPASNQLSWQWCAGSGFDASPFFRVFNPLRQGRKFDPQGEYVRRWVPELADLVSEIGGAIHDLPSNPQRRPSSYPAPLVEHDEERREALRRFDEVKGLDR